MERKELVKIYITNGTSTIPVEASTKTPHQAAQRCAEPPDDAFYIAAFHCALQQMHWKAHDIVKNTKLISLRNEVQDSVFLFLQWKIMERK